MPTATLPDGRPVEYDRAGAGPLVLLVPGLGDRRTAWAEAADGLAAAGYTAVAYDLRGYAGDDPGAFTIRDLAADAADLLDALGGGPVAVVGHSEGGFVALELAALRPDAVRSLVVAGSAAYTDDYGRRLLAHWREVADRLGPAALTRDLLLWGFSPGFHNDRPRESRLLHTFAEDRALSREVFAAHVRACETHDARPRLPGLAVPTLLLGGADDIVMTLRHNRLMHRLIPGSRIVTLPGVGHHLFAEAPDECLEHVLDHLRATAPTGGQS